MNPEILEMVENMLKKNKYNPENPKNSNIIQAYQEWTELVLERLKDVGPRFIGEQTALKAMNPGKPKLFNPATPLLPPPIGGGFVTDSLDAPSSNIPRSTKEQRDIHINNYKGKLVQVKNGGPTSFRVDGPKTIFPGGKTHEQLHKELNVYNEEQTRQNSELIDISSPHQTGKKGMKIEEPFPGVQYDVPDYEKIFERKRYGPGYLGPEQGGEFYKPKNDSLARKNARTRRQMANHDVFFSKEDFERGFSEGEDIDGVDSNFYMPFFFEDLRKPDRRLYFRAFLTRFNESLIPEWSQEKFYGRIDPVAIYKNTSRSFNVGFKIAAFSPAGFSAMWKKVNVLSKMVYPTYSNNVMVASPVIRMRIGDVCADGTGRGLPGFISSPIQLDYTNVPWEIGEFRGPTSRPAPGIEIGKAPMIIDCSFTFQVIHQDNPEIDSDYNFDVTNFRRIGTLEDIFAEFLTEDEEEDNPSTEVEDGTATDADIGSTDLEGISRGVA